MGALTASSRSVGCLWWVVCITPPLSLLVSIGVERADSGTGNVMAPLMLAAFALAPVVIVRALRSDQLTGEDRRLVIGLALATVPMFVLAAQASWWVGWPEQRKDLLYVFFPLTAAWVWLAVILRNRLRR